MSHIFRKYKVSALRKGKIKDYQTIINVFN